MRGPASDLVALRQGGRVAVGTDGPRLTAKNRLSNDVGVTRLERRKPTLIEDELRITVFQCAEPVSDEKDGICSR